MRAGLHGSVPARSDRSASVLTDLSLDNRCFSEQGYSDTRQCLSEFVARWTGNGSLASSRRRLAQDVFFGHDSGTLGRFLVVLSLDVISLGSCAWLQRELSRLTLRIRRRLFPTQLFYLAIADTIFSLSLLGIIIIDSHFVTSAPKPVCYAFNCVSRFGRNMSLPVELHIAVTFSSVIFRLSNLSMLQRMLQLLWMIAAVVTSISVMTDPVIFDHNGDLGALERVNLWSGNVTVEMIAACVTSCTGSYIFQV